MPKPKKDIKIGDTIGKLTVLKECERNCRGHLTYFVRCNCGKEYKVARTAFFARNVQCEDCGRMERSRKLRESFVGKEYGVWKVLAHVNADHYKCMCSSCGTVSIRRKYDIINGNNERCSNCSYNYEFKIIGDMAIGTLPYSKKEFIIDVLDIPLFEKYVWGLNKDGYIVTTKNHKEFFYHKMIMGNIYRKDIYVDHINRNTLDCRRVNLRLVTCQQNSMNKSLQSNSTTGFAGVSYINSIGRYRAQIGINEKDIYLGRSTNPVECAQMYNIASELLFGEFRGHINDVPKPSAKLVAKITQKLKPYMREAEIATQPYCNSLLEQIA